MLKLMDYGHIFSVYVHIFVHISGINIQKESFLLSNMYVHKPDKNLGYRATTRKTAES